MSLPPVPELERSHKFLFFYYFKSSEPKPVVGFVLFVIHGALKDYLEMISSFVERSFHMRTRSTSRESRLVSWGPR